MAPIPRLRDYQGPALLSYGFRPFFLFGSLYAGLAILAWLPMFYGELALSTAFAPRDWHIHEMLYGYVPAIVAGFLLTAIPNWTGRLPVCGAPLAALVLLWLAGRIAMLATAGTGLAVAIYIIQQQPYNPLWLTAILLYLNVFVTHVLLVVAFLAFFKTAKN